MARFVEEFGSQGETLVLVHGLGGSTILGIRRRIS